MYLLKVLYLLIILIFFLFFGKLNIKENIKSKKVFVLSYENEINNDHQKYLEDKLKYYGYRYKFLGSGEKWKGFGTKIKAYQNFIKNTKLDDDDILVIIDSRDIYVNRNSNELLKEFEKLYKKRDGDFDNNLKLLFSSEVACCTPGIIPESKQRMKDIALKHENMKQIDGSYYLNSGMCIGYIKAYKEIYLKFDIDLTDDDQTKITNYWLDNYFDKIILDYDQDIFSNAHKWGNQGTLNGCNYEKNKFRNNQFVIKDTNKCPFFIQTPAKYWICYNYLYDIKDTK
jgi:hypothetical protein